MDAFKYTKIKKGNPLRKTWVIEVTFEHGDGDDTDIETLKYDKERLAAKDYLILRDLIGVFFGRKREGIPEGFEDFIPHDKFSNGNAFAMITDVKVFYYDEDGDEYQCLLIEN